MHKYSISPLTAVARYLFCALLCVHCLQAAAQNPFFLKLSRSNGLPSDAVYKIYQDRKGYIWLATDEGLCRYDGSEYILYRSPIQTSTSGSCIQEDKYGRIWYESFDGYLYYTDSGSLKTIKQHTPDYYIPYGITEKYLFITQKNGIDIFDLRTLELIKTLPLNIYKLESTAQLNNSFCFVADDHIYKVGNDLVITSVICPSGAEEGVRLVNSYGKDISIVSRSNEHKTLYVYNTDLILLQQIPVAVPKLINSGIYSDNKFWINTSDGSYVYTPGTMRANDVKILFSGKSVSDVLKDRQGNYWFATTNEGVFIVPDLQNKIHSIDGHTPCRIVATNNGLLIGTKKGDLLLADHKLSSVQRIAINGNKTGIYYLYSDSDNVIYSSLGFSMAPTGNITRQQAYDYALKSIVRVDEKYYAAAGSGYSALIRNPACDKNAISAWDKKFTTNIHLGSLQLAHLQYNIRAKSITYDPIANKIICASNKGLFSIGTDSTTELTLNGNHMYANIVTAYKGVVYALTSKGSIYKITGTDTVQAMDAALGAHEDIRLLKQFGADMYFTRNSGLYHYYLSTGKLRAVDINIDAHDINDILRHNDTLWIATDDGIIEIIHETRSGVKAATRFYINTTFVNDHRRTAQEIKSLNYNERNISINYSILDFGVATPETLYYSLNEEQWQEAPAGSRTLTFPSLSSGSYVLAFKLGDKVLSDAVYFTIKPPFWQQWWFYSLCVIVITLSILGIYRWQLSSKVRKLEIQNEKIQLEQDLGRSILTSIRAQMNPHFFYNALNTIQAYIFTNDKTKASNYLAKFSKLTRIILEMSDTETVSLKEETDALKLYLELEKMRFNSGFEYEIAINRISTNELIEIPSMIIQPYVENAVKHGLLHKEGDKLLVVAFELANGRLLVTVDDNGIGRKKADELNKIRSERFKSFSTQANSKRMDLLNRGKTEKVFVTTEDKVTATGQTAGTRVTISIPI